MRHVALLVETSSSYGRDLLQGINRYVVEHGPWSMYLELRALNSDPPVWLNGWQGDGILTRTGSAQIAEALQRTNVPIVELRTTRLHPESQKIPFVGVDNQALGRLVAQHLIERGFKHFGVYQLDTEDYFVERSRNFVSFLTDEGYPVETLQLSQLQESPAEWERHQEELAAWLKKLPKPVGLMACTDQFGYWLLDACARAGISVPEEAAVVGCGNEETLCTMSSPQLSSVIYEGNRIGYEAAKLLDQMMHGGAEPKKKILIPCHQISVRRSSDMMAINDPHLSQAIRMIRADATKGIMVSDVLREVPLSRSTLERKMKEVLGRSPREEILRVRLEVARQLLSSTDLSLDQIANRSGFRTAQYFCTAFLKAQDQTPGAYRKQTRF